MTRCWTKTKTTSSESSKERNSSTYLHYNSGRTRTHQPRKPTEKISLLEGGSRAEGGAEEKRGRRCLRAVGGRFIGRKSTAIGSRCAQAHRPKHYSHSRKHLLNFRSSSTHPQQLGTTLLGWRNEKPHRLSQVGASRNEEEKYSKSRESQLYSNREAIYHGRVA